MRVGHLTQGLLHVLLISILQSSRGVALLLSPFTQSLANIILRLSFNRVLPSVGGTYNLACCILTKVSKSLVGMTNN
jgi:hypothetical protein